MQLWSQLQSYGGYPIKEYYDDQEEYQTDQTLYTPLNTCAKTDLLERMAGKLESLIRMYITTEDKAYLYKCIKHIQHIQSLRGTFSGDFHCEAETHNHFSKNWTPSYYQNGLIIWPMAHFVHLVKVEETTLQSISLNPHTDLNLSSGDYSNFGEFANWLGDRVSETLIQAIDHYWLGDDYAFAPKANQTIESIAPMTINMQSSFAAALLYMGLAYPYDGVSVTYDFLHYAKHIAELYKSEVEFEDLCTGCSFNIFTGCQCSSYKDDVLIYNSFKNSYKWYGSGWRVSIRDDCFGCSGQINQPNIENFTEIHEDLSHAAQDLIFPHVANRFNLSSSNSVHFDDAVMTRFKNTFTKNVWKGYSPDYFDEFYNTVWGDDFPNNSGKTAPNLYHQWSLNYMPLQKFDDNNSEPVYQIIMRYYKNVIHNSTIQDEHLFTERVHIYWGLSEVVAAQWDKECPNLILKNRKVVYNQNFYSQNTLTIDPFATNVFDPANINSFADPVIQDNKFTIEPGVTANFRAVSRIVIKPGSHAKLGCNSRGYIDPFACISMCKMGSSSHGSGSSSNELDLTDTFVEKAYEHPEEQFQLDQTKEVFDFQFNSNNYPNPFTSHTHIDYYTSEKGRINVSIFDMFGHLVTTLVNNQHIAGKHTVTFDAQGISEGIYFYKIIKDGVVIETQKMVKTKM